MPARRHRTMRSTRAAATAVTGLFLILASGGLASLAIDYQWYASQRDELQIAVENAAVAIANDCGKTGGSGLCTDPVAAREHTRQILALNLADLGSAQRAETLAEIETSLVVDVGTDRHPALFARGPLGGTLLAQHFIGGVEGDQRTYGQTGTVCAPGAIDLVIAVDMAGVASWPSAGAMRVGVDRNNRFPLENIPGLTGSFADRLKTKIEALKKRCPDVTLRVGLVPYQGTVRLPLANPSSFNASWLTAGPGAGQKWWGCVEERFPSTGGEAALFSSIVTQGAPTASAPLGRFVNPNTAALARHLPGEIQNAYGHAIRYVARAVGKAPNRTAFDMSGWSQTDPRRPPPTGFNTYIPAYRGVGWIHPLDESKSIYMSAQEARRELQLGFANIARSRRHVGGDNDWGHLVRPYYDATHANAVNGWRAADRVEPEVGGPSGGGPGVIDARYRRMGGLLGGPNHQCMPEPMRALSTDHDAVLEVLKNLPHAQTQRHDNGLDYEYLGPVWALRMMADDWQPLWKAMAPSSDAGPPADPTNHHKIVLWLTDGRNRAEDTPRTWPGAWSIARAHFELAPDGGPAAEHLAVTNPVYAGDKALPVFIDTSDWDPSYVKPGTSPPVGWQVVKELDMNCPEFLNSPKFDVKGRRVRSLHHNELLYDLVNREGLGAGTTPRMVNVEDSTAQPEYQDTFQPNISPKQWFPGYRNFARCGQGDRGAAHLMRPAGWSMQNDGAFVAQGKSWRPGAQNRTAANDRTHRRGQIGAGQPARERHVLTGTGSAMNPYGRLCKPIDDWPPFPAYIIGGKPPKLPKGAWRFRRVHMLAEMPAYIYGNSGDPARGLTRHFDPKVEDWWNATEMTQRIAGEYYDSVRNILIAQGVPKIGPGGVDLVGIVRNQPGAKVIHFATSAGVKPKITCRPRLTNHAEWGIARYVSAYGALGRMGSIGAELDWTSERAAQERFGIRHEVWTEAHGPTEGRGRLRANSTYRSDTHDWHDLDPGPLDRLMVAACREVVKEKQTSLYIVHDVKREDALSLSLLESCLVDIDPADRDHHLIAVTDITKSVSTSATSGPGLDALDVMFRRVTPVRVTGPKS